LLILLCGPLALAQTATGTVAGQEQAAPANIELDRSLSQYLGRNVVEVSISTASADDVKMLLDMLPLKPGVPLTRAALRESLQKLFASGKFEQLSAEAEPVGDRGVRITFHVEKSFFVGALRVNGAPNPPTGIQLSNATKFSLGQTFRQSDLDAGIGRMQSLMQENGYYRGTIATQTVRHTDIQQIDLLFRVSRGVRARVGQVLVQGSPDESLLKIEDIAHLHPGDSVTAKRINRALIHLRKHYQKDNRLEGEVALLSKQYQPASNTVDYTLRLSHGPKVDIELQGARLRRGIIKRLVPIYAENAIDDDLLNEGMRNLSDYFQGQGFFDVKVNYSQPPPTPAERKIIYKVELGERHKLVSLDITGNRYFDTATLRERMQVQPASLLQDFGHFSQTMLARDLQSIENLYRSNGFQNVKVKSDVIDDYLGQRGRIKVIIAVEEGAQTRVAKLTVDGVSSLPLDQVMDQLTTTDGQPYSEANVAADRDSLSSFYYNHGFPNVTFDAFATPVANDPTRMNVTYKIVEGPQYFVDHVYISGLHYTRPQVVERELQVHPGDPLSQAEMLETQRRLYDLGIFSEADVAVQDPDGDLPKKNVLLQMDEARRYTFDYGLGLEVQTGDVGTNCNGGTTVGGTSSCRPQGRTGVSPRASFGVTRINFLRRNHTVIFKARYGRLQQRALFSYEAPRAFGNPSMRLTFTAFYDKTQDVRTFTAERLEGSVQTYHQISKSTTLLYRLAYRRVRVDPRTLQVDINLVPLLSRPVRVGLPSFTYLRDTRDDPTDSHRGSYNTADLGVASQYVGSDANFSRLLLQNSTYKQFHFKRWVFARSTRIGVEEPFGGGGRDFVPLPERFFAGGGNSHRGFAINQAGPRDAQTGFPLGGSAMFLNNMELRSPPILLPYVQDNLSAVIFHDMGNVFSSAGDIFPSFFKLSQGNRSQCSNLASNVQCDMNYFSHAIGAGLRYRTPIGPVRIDLGYNLNPPIFAVRVPSTQQHIEQLKHFNVYFSIGQTF